LTCIPGRDLQCTAYARTKFQEKLSWTDQAWYRSGVDQNVTYIAFADKSPHQSHATAALAIFDAGYSL